MDLWRPAAESYAAFAGEAADSPCFADWATSVADDPEVLARIETLPRIKQQPNLVFAAARWHGVPAPGPYAGLREALLGDWEPIRRTVLARSTQTNEVGRLATLLPVFAALAGVDGVDGGGGTGGNGAGEVGGIGEERPLALIEAGASAGLCLYPDRYRYEFSGDGSGTRLGAGPVLRCETTGPVPLPSRVPEVAWRAGVDLSPLDVRDADQTAWLEMLVWPEQRDRRERLAEAVRVARREPPHLVAGDLLEELPALLEQAPDGAVPVVFHSAVLAYLTPADRERFVALIGGLVSEGRCRWVSNEAPGVLPGVAATVARGQASASAGSAPQTHFLLAVDGRAVARTHGHGRVLQWLTD
ncbi:DUF2332 domain-containing protein [Nocardioides donggukensis]|uniref:DUF2332 domain-containing protein n=1 Tax=Nocardioides donggukensis TaxID=2774019 RepID=A0A927K8U2_9ACTN|nr:DUF2332 domain-containing protein [Nocardioides donggukensis]MBD8871103.1 DUF2332 domain-containing protein [Nocardioides donggukensis]